MNAVFDARYDTDALEDRDTGAPEGQLIVRYLAEDIDPARRPAGRQAAPVGRFDHNYLEFLYGIETGITAIGIVDVTGSEVLIRELNFAVTEKEGWHRSYGDADITSSMLRAVPVGDIRAWIVTSIERDPSLLNVRSRAMSEADPDEWRRFKQLREWVYGRYEPDISDPVLRAKREAKTLRKPESGHGARSDAFYRQIALDYLRLVDEGNQSPIKTLTKERSAPNSRLSRNTVSGWVRRARELDWLTKSSRGRAGGGPGPRLVAWRNRHTAYEPPYENTLSEVLEEAVRAARDQEEQT